MLAPRQLRPLILRMAIGKFCLVMAVTFFLLPLLWPSKAFAGHCLPKNEFFARLESQGFELEGGGVSPNFVLTLWINNKSEWRMLKIGLDGKACLARVGTEWLKIKRDCTEDESCL